MITISKATIEPMLDIMERFNDEQDVRDELSSLLDTQDYQLEFARYQSLPENSRFTKEQYIDFFLNICSPEVENAPQILKRRAEDLLYIMNNVDYYRRVYKNIKKFNESDLEKSLKLASYGLPEQIKLDDFHIIFNIGLGPSVGWIHNKTTQYDLKSILDKNSEFSLTSTIAHELHHVGFSELMSTLNEEQLFKHMDLALVIYLSGEGLAVKYCNNYDGILTKKIYDNEIDIHANSYNYYRDNFDDIYQKFKNDIRLLRSGEVKSLNDFASLFMKNYNYTNAKINGQMKVNYLGQPITYHLGADIWGLIHDIYGREKVFELLKDTTSFFEYYNKALLKINRGDLVV
jgi:hypothetical protein